MYGVRKEIFSVQEFDWYPLDLLQKYIKTHKKKAEYQECQGLEVPLTHPLVRLGRILAHMARVSWG